MYQPHLLAMNMSCFLMVWFFILLLFGSSRTKVSAFILFVAWCFYSITSITGMFDRLDYLASKRVLILIDGLTALILTMFLIFDKSAWKYSLILAFAVLCHTMIIYDLTIASSWFTLFFYSYYDELIITVGLLQMGVSYNGFIESLGRVQKLLSRTIFYSNSSCKGLSTQEKRDSKA